jgi:hypothetical protein
VPITLSGDAGNDTYQIGSYTGALQLDPGAGSNTVDFSLAPEGVTIDLDQTNVAQKVTKDTGLSVELLNPVENFVGSPQNDIVTVDALSVGWPGSSPVLGWASMKRAVANLPPHGGDAPAWLFKRMARLSGAVTMAIVDGYGAHEMLRRASIICFLGVRPVICLNRRANERVGIATSLPMSLTVIGQLAISVSDTLTKRRLEGGANSYRFGLGRVHDNSLPYGNIDAVQAGEVCWRVACRLALVGSCQRESKLPWTIGVRTFVPFSPVGPSLHTT